MREASSAQEGRYSEASQRVRSAEAERMAAVRSAISGRASQRLNASGEVLFARARERREWAGSASCEKICSVCGSEGAKRVSDAWSGV